MSTPGEKLASSLAVLNEKQADGRSVFRSSEFTRSHRERLLRRGFLQVAIKGWVVSSSPSATEGDTTPWFSSFWEFCGRYCSHRFDEDWHLSPQLSLDLHAEKSKIPTQVVVYSPRAQNNRISLPHGTSLFAVKQPGGPPRSALMSSGGLRVFRPEAALVRVPASYYRLSPTEAEVVLAGIRDPSALLHRLLEGGHSTIAGRLAGALRRVQRPDLADEIVSAMQAAGYDVRESDPFEVSRPTTTAVRTSSPAIVTRLERLWASGREAVLETFPAPPATPPEPAAYLAAIDDIYQHDAYHSLSIEGHRVTPELVARVASGDWNPDDDDLHRRDKDALAARGYFQAFKLVRNAVEQAYGGNDPSFVRHLHRDWFRELFAPHVAVGLLDAPALAGYRNTPVFLRGSRHMPPRWEVLRYAMPTLFDLIEQEPEPAVRAVLGHWLFGYVHPFPDGNGRTARFVMNALFATVGFPWTVIRVEDRGLYLKALEQASAGGNVRPFVAFVEQQMELSKTIRLGVEARR